MPRHLPETAERRVSPGHPREPTSTGILCAHASAPTGNCRAPCFTQPPTGAHFYRNPVFACPGTDRKQLSAVLHPATLGNPLLPESCVRMRRHRPESAERRASPGDHWEPTSTGILCTHASAPTGNSRAPRLTQSPTGAHVYRNPVCAPLVSTGNSRAPRLTNHPWNPCPTGIPSARPRCRLESAERRGIEVILVQESCVRKHGVIGLWRTPVSCWVRDSPSSYRKQACALPSVILQGGGPSVLRSART